MSQITNHIMMIRPAHFGYNEETAINNSFQTESSLADSTIHKKAVEEFEAMVDKLRSNDVHLTVIRDTASPVKPDAIFPNNWISFHENSVIVTYPMFAENRRIERREEIIQEIAQLYEIDQRYSFEYYEDDEKFLEGTGSMLLDRENKIVYACLSPRTDIMVLEKFCVLTGYRKVVFHSYDRAGEEIYHTNVMMGLGIDFAVICLESIHNLDERDAVIKSLDATGKTIIEISYDQVEAFAGNMLQVGTKDHHMLVMSQSAYESLADDQIRLIEEHTDILSCSIPTIENTGGGSVRCMMAEIFLPPKNS